MGLVFIEAIEDSKKRYLKWMYDLVCPRGHHKGFTYKRLINSLHNIEFTYIIGLDKNRAEDGIDLRYRFGCEYKLPGTVLVNSIDNSQCSVLEMMIALAIRCEEHIMEDTTEGDRTSVWFWNMIESLGLLPMTDSHFNNDRVQHIIDIFLSRKHERNGKGGLFIIHRSSKDMRTTDIWYQMCAYLDEILYP